MDIDQLMEKAGNGDYQSALELSRIYREGDGVEQDEDLAQQYEDWARELQEEAGEADAPSEVEEAAAEMASAEEESAPENSSAEEEESAEEAEAPAEEAEAPGNGFAEEEESAEEAEAPENGYAEEESYESEPEAFEEEVTAEAENDQDLSSCNTWEEMRKKLEKMSFPELREQMQKNPFAEIVYWSRYLKSNSEEEVQRGMEHLHAAIDHLRDRITRGEGSHLEREAIADIYEHVGDYYKKMVKNGQVSDEICQNMWKAYEQAEELDESRVEGILFCLEYNFIPNNITADECDRRKHLYAKKCGISFRVDFANDLYSRGRSIEALDMYQMAQIADDADEQPSAKDYADFMAAKISKNAEKQEIAKKKLLAHYEGEDAEAAYFLARMEDNLDNKLQYYSKGKDWDPQKYADKCRQQYRILSDAKSVEDQRALQKRKEEEHQTAKNFAQYCKQNPKTVAFLGVCIAIILYIILRM